MEIEPGGERVCVAGFESVVHSLIVQVLDFVLEHVPVGESGNEIVG